MNNINILNLDYNNYFKSKDSKPLDNAKRLKTLRTIYTTFYKDPMLKIYLNEILPGIKYEDLTTKHFENIQLFIKQKIEDYKVNKNDQTLLKIFHAIQLWGGGMAKSIYTRGDKFDKNFSLDGYNEMINFIENDQSQKLFNFIENNPFHKFGIAFLTKHYYFWSLYLKGKENTYPILDSIMYENLKENLKSTNAKTLPNKAKVYKEYYNLIKNIADKNNTTIYQVEKVLFNIFDS